MEGDVGAAGAVSGGDVGDAAQSGDVAGGVQSSASQDSGAAGAAVNPVQDDWSLSVSDFDGQDISPGFIDGYAAVAKEVGLPRDKACVLLSKAADLANRMDEQAVREQADAWVRQAKTDAEFGGAALDANLAVAKRGLEAFGGEPLKMLLDSTGLGNHPEVIRFFWKVGKAVSEDSFQRGQAGSRPATFDDLAKRLYPSMQ